MASLARSVYLTRIAAWEPAAESLLDTLERAAELSRVWMQYWGRSLLAVVEANLRAAERPVATSTPVESEHDVRLVGLLTGLPGAEVALLEGRLDDVLSLAKRDAERSLPTPNQVRALDLVARARLEKGDLEAAAAAAERGLTIAETMQLGSAIWRLRMVQATALGEPTDVAVAEFRALADRISEPELRWWFERQPLAPR